jgi:hypothetical protein
MALRIAVASGNWSNPATWNGGVLPGPDDVVASNNFTVTINQDVNIDTLTNAARSIIGLVPNMTSDTAPSGIVTASSFLSGYLPYYAFGGDNNSEWRYDGSQWIGYEFPSAKAVNQYTFSGYTNQTGWTFEGWNGTSWVVLHTVTGVSVITYTSPLIGNSTPYIKYRLNISTVLVNQRIHTIQFYEYLGTTTSVAGGGFTLNNGVSATATNGFYNGASVQLVTFSLGSGQSASLIGNLYSGLVTGPNSAIGGVVAMNGVGTLNIIGTLYSGGQTNAEALKINSAGTINITGNIEDNNSAVTRQVIIFLAAATINITGNIVSGTTAGGTTIAGTLVNGGGTAFKLYITGNVLSSLNSCILSTGASYMSIVGTIQTIKNTVNNGAAFAVTSSNGGATNIFSGPFICSDYGVFPYQVVRMHLIPSVGTYFEFRDETTNGALSPGAIAPATRMIAPAAVSDAPAANDVRFGTIYANGSLTGTLKMPSPVSVAYGIPVDNTVGSAVINAEDIWNVATEDITTTDSIGARLKNASTVQTTAAQLAGFQ